MEAGSGYEYYTFGLCLFFLFFFLALYSLHLSIHVRAERGGIRGIES
jgi:hypothetical protein